MAYRESVGRGLVGSIAPKLWFLGDPKAHFECIDTDTSLSSEQRLQCKRGALLQIMHATSRSGEDWVNFYRAVDFVKKNDWFWRELGFESFDDYWKDKTGPAFQTWGELEAMHSFAKIACPKMFTMTREEAFALYSELARLRQITPLGAHGTNRHTKIFENKDQAIERITVASTYYSPSPTSLERRFARIRRDSPDTASKILLGEYLKETESGKISIDISKAEIDVYGQSKRKTTSSVTIGSRAKSLAKKIKTTEDAKEAIKELSENSLITPFLQKSALR